MCGGRTDGTEGRDAGTHSRRPRSVDLIPPSLPPPPSPPLYPSFPSCLASSLLISPQISPCCFNYARTDAHALHFSSCVNDDGENSPPRMHLSLSLSLSRLSLSVSLSSSPFTSRRATRADDTPERSNAVESHFLECTRSFAEGGCGWRRALFREIYSVFQRCVLLTLPACEAAGNRGSPSLVII